MNRIGICWTGKEYVIIHSIALSLSLSFFFVLCQHEALAPKTLVSIQIDLLLFIYVFFFPFLSTEAKSSTTTTTTTLNQVKNGVISFPLSSLSRRGLLLSERKAAATGNRVRLSFQETCGVGFGALDSIIAT